VGQDGKLSLSIPSIPNGKDVIVVTGPADGTFEAMRPLAAGKHEFQTAMTGGSCAAHDECPEEEKDGLDDAHGLRLPHLRNGQSYWDASGWQTVGKAVSSRSPQNPQLRIFPEPKNRLS
jgi:hypothetical protein